MSQYKKPVSWTVWHPHQGLWNWDLITAVRRFVPLTLIQNLVTKLIVLIDTTALFIKVVAKRISRVGFKHVFSRANLPQNVSILYLDLGTHREASELSFMVNKILPNIGKTFYSYGFEASRESFEYAKAQFSGRENVSLVNNALCYSIPSNSKIRLYKDMKGGIGDSLYRPSENYEEIQAIRLSDWLSDNNFDLQSRVCLLRMNIEGAEYDVIRDLVSCGVARYIDGYYGMWDDLSKIDSNQDKEFQAYLSENKIYPITFNGRDLNWPMRMKCIEYDINTAVLSGVCKIRSR